MKSVRLIDGSVGFRHSQWMVLAKRLLILLASFGLSNAFAADLHVPDEHPTIQAALNASWPRDVIWVKPGLYRESLNFGGKDVAVRGAEGAKNTILSPPDYQKGADIGPLGELSGMTISNATSAVEAFGAGSIIRSNIFIKNRRGNWGSGVGGNFASPRIEQNIFTLNEAPAGQIFSAVLVFANGSSPQIINNLFVSNNCAAISMVLPSGNNVLVLNNTFVANRTAIYHRTFSPITYRNNIIFGNDIGFEWDYADPPIWNNNLVYGNNVDYQRPVTGSNNISVPPNFYNIARGDFRLTRNSPAVDSGADGPAVDINGRPRPLDGNLDGSAIVDRGAYEYLPGPPNPPTIASVASFPTSIELTWLGEPETQTYIVFRSSIQGGPFTEIGRTTELSFTDSAATPNTEYFYAVAGLNDLGIGAKSLEVRERGGNLPPVAVADEFQVDEDSYAVLKPLLNDSDSNGDTISLHHVADAINGFTKDEIYFRPPANFWGTNTIEYVITDGRSRFATNQITVRVLPVNDAPTAGGGSYSVPVGGAVDIQLFGSDIDSNALTFEIVSEPLFGRLELTNNSGQARYFAGRSVSSWDTFSFRVFDGELYSETNHVQLQRIPFEDRDRDGLPDYWELQHDLNNPTGDRDADSVMNANEYLANTNPNDPGSVLKFNSTQVGEDGSIILRWDAVGNIRYRLQTASNPTGPFTDLVRPSSDEVFAGSEGQRGVAEFRIPDSMDRGRFFRVTVVP